MTDAHCHISCGDNTIRELLIGRDFFGIHPWQTLPPSPFVGTDPAECLENLHETLLAHPAAGVGEIGLDRLKVRDMPSTMREVFELQLALAVELGRPVVLHGAKCWGQVVATVRRIAKDSSMPLLFHGFSRSGGLIPEIVRLNGYFSVGPAVLNDHAANYRALVKQIPLGRLLVETDRDDAADGVSIRDVLARTADVLGLAAGELERITDENAARFFRLA